MTADRDFSARLVRRPHRRWSVSEQLRLALVPDLADLGGDRARVPPARGRPSGGWPARRGSWRPGRPRSPRASTSIGSSTSRAPYQSRTRSPGDAGQAAAGERRRAELAVDDVEDVGAGALAQVALEVGEDRLARARARGRAARARTFSPYDVVLRPASAPRSLRGQGTVATAAVSGQGSIGAATTTSDGGPSPRSEPRGARPPVHVMRTRPSVSGSPSSTACDAAAYGVDVDVGQAEALAPTGPAARGAGRARRPPVDDLDAPRRRRRRRSARGRARPPRARPGR